MLARTSPRRGRLGLLVSATAAAVVLAACSSTNKPAQDQDSTPPAGTTGAAASTNAAGTTGASTSVKGSAIAFLDASSANTFLQATDKTIKSVAADNGITVTDFDAKFQSSTQVQQLQDAIASGKYKGIIIAAVDGTTLIPGIQAAVAKGIKVVVDNQVVGPRLDTADPQVPGLSASVLTPPTTQGERMGKLTVQACAGKSPCRVVYFYGIKGVPLDTALKDGFDSAVKGDSAIQVVATGQGQYLGPDVALKAMQDILARTKDVDVVVGGDQSIQGVQLALQSAGLLGSTKLVGYGGSSQAIKAVQDGTWFGDVYTAPVQEGKLAMQAMIDALSTGKVTGGVSADLPNDGMVTKSNVSQFKAEW
jgi:ribose transport system substrate-binding protein